MRRKRKSKVGRRNFKGPLVENLRGGLGLKFSFLERRRQRERERDRVAMKFSVGIIAGNWQVACETSGRIFTSNK